MGNFSAEIKSRKSRRRASVKQRNSSRGRGGVSERCPADDDGDGDGDEDVLEANHPLIMGSNEAGRYRYQWYQSYDWISVEVFVKGTKQKPEDAVVTKFEAKRFILRVEDGHEDGPYELNVALADEIVAGESKVERLSTKVELRLRKREAGRQWPGLEQGGDKVSATRTMANGSQPTAAANASDQETVKSKKKSPKEWAALEAELDELEKDEKPEGEAALQALFKDIYAKADPDTQRAMMKSFQESNGTVLSTNWSEVGSKKVEVQPPDGMEAKKYEH